MGQSGGETKYGLPTVQGQCMDELPQGYGTSILDTNMNCLVPALGLEPGLLGYEVRLLSSAPIAPQKYCFLEYIVYQARPHS